MGIQSVDIEESKQRIKQAVEWFPGATLPCGRQSGKTTAILEMIHERHKGKAVFFTVNPDMAKCALDIYRKRWPKDEDPIFTASYLDIRGRSLPIYVDEPWFATAENRRILQDLDYLIVCRLGTRL